MLECLEGAFGFAFLAGLCLSCVSTWAMVYSASGLKVCLGHGSYQAWPLAPSRSPSLVRSSFVPRRRRNHALILHKLRILVDCRRI